MAALLLALPLGLAELDGLPEEVLLADELADPEPEAEVGEPLLEAGAARKRVRSVSFYMNLRYVPCYVLPGALTENG